MTDIQKTIVVTGVGVISPYGIGLDCLQAGMLSGKCCLAPTNDLYPGFEGTTAQVQVRLMDCRIRRKASPPDIPAPIDLRRWPLETQ